jgi:RNA polymerase sigma factor (sigma-70 family)
VKDGTEQQEHGWARLMVAAQGGDSRAYEELLRSTAPFIRALVRRRTAAPDQVEDIVQDVLLCVHRVRNTYDPTRPFTPWLASIAARRTIDGLRRRSRIARYESPEDTGIETLDTPAANNELEDSDSARELRQLFAELPDGQRQALEMLKLREMSLAEAAAASGQSVGALKVSVHRGMKALRAILAAKINPEDRDERNR